MMKDIYEEWRSYENDHVLLRPVTAGDGEKLLEVYSDHAARPLFNCDNFPNPCYFDTCEEMNREIQFYLDAYSVKAFVRWVIEWKGEEPGQNIVIGSLENFRRHALKEDGSKWDSFHGVSLLRMDLLSTYEKENVIRAVMELVISTAYNDFHTTVIATKAVEQAAVRRRVLEEMGFCRSEENIFGHHGEIYGDYYLRDMGKAAKKSKTVSKFDFKKEFREYYLPESEPGIIEIPSMNFIAVKGKGNPNDPEGEYAKAVAMLYQIAYTIKMSYKGERKIKGFYEYVVPPLEGLWWMEKAPEEMEIGADNGRKRPESQILYSNKEAFCWISMIRIPYFVKQEDVEWAIGEASMKKKADCSKVTFFTYQEGLCIQCMHTGPFDTEPETIDKMRAAARKLGYVEDISDSRLHHEIYLSDVNKTEAEKWKTVIRHPVI